MVANVKVYQWVYVRKEEVTFFQMQYSRHFTLFNLVLPTTFKLGIFFFHLTDLNAERFINILKISIYVATGL